jgi:hypothetical protein
MEKVVKDKHAKRNVKIKPFIALIIFF